MAASTAWSVQIRMMTASNAPKMFKELGKAADASGSAVDKLERKVKSFAKTIESARFTRAFAKISSGFTGIEKSSENFAKKMTATADTSVIQLDRVSAGMKKIDSAFVNSRRYAGGFARTVGAVSRASSSELGAVSSSLNLVRSNAYAAAGAVRTLASAARSVPRTVRAGGGAGASGGPGTGTFALAGLGMAAGGGLLSGVRGAADLQTAMVAVRNATGANPQQMEMLRQRAYDLSAMTAQSVGDSAHIMAVMARSGINDPAKLMQISKPAALFADVQFLSRGVAFEEGAKNAIMLAHLFHAYDPADATKMFDQMTRLSEMMPDNLSKAVTQMGYFVPQLKALGVGNDQNIALMALLDRVGYGRGKGGTGVAALVMNALGPLQLTKHAQVGKSELLRQIGVLGAGGQSLFYDKKTQSFDMIGFLHQLGKYGATHDRAQTVKTFTGAFGVGGGRIADMATDKNFISQLNQIIHFMGRTDLSMIEQQKRYMNTLSGQFQLFTTNFKSFLTDMMWPWLDRLRDTFAWLGDHLHQAQAWMHQHPTARKAAGLGLAGIAGLGGVASLAIGGYVSGHILNAITGGALGSAASHAIGHSASGAAKGISLASRIGGGVSSLARGIFGALSLSGTRAFPGIAKVGFAEVEMSARLMARGLVHAHIGMGFILKTLAKLGLRAIPVAGEILMLIDAVKFLGSHSKEIGKGIGMAAKWIVAHGLPMLLDAFKSLIMGIFDFVAGFFKGGPGGFIGSIKSGWQGLVAGWNYDTPKPKGNIVPMHAAHAKHVAHAATGGYARGEGLTYLHKNELVVNDKLTRRLERMTAGGGTQTTRHEHVVRLEGGIPNNPSDLRKLAHMLADILSVDVAYDSRAGGSIPQMSGHSFFDIAQGMPA